MPYSIPYIIFISFILSIFFLQNSLKLTQRTVMILNLSVFLAYLLFFGFRGFIGWDWTIYYPFYEKLDNLFQLNLEKIMFDIGFTIYASLIKTLGFGFHSFVCISTFINVILLHVFFKRYLPEKYYALGFAIFVVFGGFVFETDLMRNIKSLLLFLLSLKYIENRSPYKFLLFNILGLFFHWSSIMFLPLYFFLHKPISVKTISLITIIGVVVFILKIEYIKPLLLFVGSLFGNVEKYKITFYVHSSLFGSAYDFSLGFFERIFTLLLILLSYKNLTTKKTSNILFINAFFIYIVIFLFFSEVTIALVRFGNLFVFSYWILWPMLITCVNTPSKLIYTGLILIILFFKINIVSGNILYKYDNILIGNIKTYDKRKIIFYENYERLQK